MLSNIRFLSAFAPEDSGKDAAGNLSHLFDAFARQRRRRCFRCRLHRSLPGCITPAAGLWISGFRTAHFFLHLMRLSLLVQYFTGTASVYRLVILSKKGRSPNQLIIGAVV